MSQIDSSKDVPTTLEPSIIPSTEVIRLRLAIVLTEASVLRKQLVVSQRNERERARLQKLMDEFVKT